jgi:hypothetical protein
MVLAALIVSIASLLAAFASVYIAQQSEVVSQQSLDQAQKVSDRDQENWRQRTWFDLYLKASEAYDFFDMFQAKYKSGHSFHVNVENPSDWNHLMALMRQTHAMAAVFPKNNVIDELFASTAVFKNQSEALSPERLTKIFNAVQNLRDQALLHVNVLGNTSKSRKV